MNNKMILLYKILNHNTNQISSTTKSNNIVQWVPILSVGRTKRLIGITQEGDWGVETADGFCLFDKLDKFLYVLELLEVDFDKLNSLLICDLPEEKTIYDIFPYTEVIAFAFEYEWSDYWLEFAFKWYDKLEHNKKALLRNSLANVVKNGKVSQRLRHLAKHKLNECG